MRAIPLSMTLLACALLLAPVDAALAQTPTPPAADTASPPPPVPMTAEARALLAAEDVRFQAELHHDAATLDRMTASDVVYSHATGHREDKAGVMFSATHLPFKSITPTDRYARVMGDIGIVRGTVARQVFGRTLKDGYLAVYVRRAGTWQLLEWVSAPPPDAPKS